MDPFQDLKTLQDKKQKLLLECEVNRQVLGLEVEIIRLRIGQWKGGMSTLPDTWKLLAPLSGFLMAGRFKGKTTRLLAIAAVGVVVATKLRGVWNLWGGKPKSAAQDSPPNGPSTPS
jgi:hypothetical protein